MPQPSGIAAAESEGGQQEVPEGSENANVGEIAGEVADSPVSPQDILATTYHLLGIDPHTLIHDRAGRPVAIGGAGRVLTEVLA